MNVFEELGISIDYVMLGVIGVVIVLLVLNIILMVKQNKLKKKYLKFMDGADGKSLEQVIVERFQEVDQLKIDFNNVNSHIVKIDETLASTFQKVGIVKYDAFREMGGKLSFAIAMLNASNDGFILNSMHSSREGCYTYIKEVIKGEAFVVLAEEEKLALEEAIKSANYLV